jgi:uncharacterized protein YjfI (DUF2170 family)
MATVTPSKYSYEEALKVVEQYEKRQKELHYLENELAFKLKQFSDVKIKIDKKSGEVLFAGVQIVTGKLLLGRSKCNSNDKFETVIGKLIAVKNALHEDIAEIVEKVEPKSSVKFMLGGISSMKLSPL